MSPRKQETGSTRSDGALNARAYSEIKRGIITHRLKPSQRISETLLSDMFELGRASVRAAIARLIEDGLIVSRSTKTQIVAPLTFADIRETFALRATLEPEAARLAAGKADIAELRRLNALCMRPYRFGDAREELAFLEANRTFHMAIAEAAHSPRLTRWIGQLQDAAMRVLWVTLKVDGRPQVWSHGHDDIIAALEAGDDVAAAARAGEHLSKGQQTVFEVLLNAPDIREISIGGIVP